MCYVFILNTRSHVQDTIAPTTAGFLTAVTVECNALPSTTLTATDLCDASPTVLFSQPRTNGRCPSVYTLARNWTLVDNCGNAAQFLQTLSVQDTQAPRVVGVPARVTVECSAIPQPATVTGSDNCDVETLVSLSEKTIAGACPFNYTLNRTWTVTDNCDNSNSSTQLLNVWDTVPPVITVVPQNLTVECDGSGNTAQLQAWLSSFAGAHASDACSGATVAWSHNFAANLWVAGCGKTGYFNVKFTVTDQCGLKSSSMARFTIVVSLCLMFCSIIFQRYLSLISYNLLQSHKNS